MKNKFLWLLLVFFVFPFIVKADYTCNYQNNFSFTFNSDRELTYNSNYKLCNYNDSDSCNLSSTTNNYYGFNAMRYINNNHSCPPYVVLVGNSRVAIFAGSQDSADFLVKNHFPSGVISQLNASSSSSNIFSPVDSDEDPVEDVQKPDITYTAEECRKLILGEQLAEILDGIFTFVLIAVPILTIVLIIKDMVSAVAASKEDDMKKAQKNAIFRIIIAVAICLVPVIVNTVLNIIGFTSGTCGIG